MVDASLDQRAVAVDRRSSDTPAMRVLGLALLLTACTTPAGSTAADASAPLAEARRVEQVAAGLYSACARFDNGTVQCWGRCGAACGRRDAEASTAMAAIDGIRDAIDIGVGDDFACAAHRDGTASCWGSNFYGTIGVVGPRFTPLPTRVSGLSDVAEIAVATHMGCARTEGGELWSWGGLPDADPPPPAESRVPTRLSTVTGATALFAAGNGCCARSSDGKYACWREGSRAPYVVPAREGDACGCTLDGAGTLRCEAYGLPGAMMNDGTVPEPPPMSCSIDALTGVEDFVISDRGGWALRNGGELWGWGEILQNQGPRPLARIDGVAKLSMLAAGVRGAVYGVDTEGNLWGWGQSYEHGITAADQWVPTPVRMWPQ
jgi:Regulator of chromosome condensation (RCC1) repeat